jgi:hypothetical protein
MKLTLTMNLDNSAFHDDDFGTANETIRCLEQVIEQLRNYRDWGAIKDSNGNTVGNFMIEGE